MFQGLDGVGFWIEVWGFRGLVFGIYGGFTGQKNVVIVSQREPPKSPRSVDPV